jgi:hypothetical protein
MSNRKQITFFKQHLYQVHVDCDVGAGNYFVLASNEKEASELAKVVLKSTIKVTEIKKAPQRVARGF